MDFPSAIILSIVEGLTEFLPISSTGHLILSAKLLNITQTDFVKSFEIFIQLGAILGAVFLYFKDLIDPKKWPKIIVAFIPSAAVGLIFYKFIKNYLLSSSEIVLVSLFVGGLVLIAVEFFYKGQNGNTSSLDKINYKQAFLIGAFQSISVIPGVSRAGATIVGGMLSGLSRKTAVEFSFILAVPTMLAATTLDLLQSIQAFNISEFQILAAGFIASFIVAIISIKFLLKFVQSHTFIPFGIYRIVVAILFWLLIL